MENCSQQFPIIFNDNFRVNPVAFFVANFNFVKLWISWYCVYTAILSHFYIDILSKQNKFVKSIHNFLNVPSKKPKIVSFTSSRTEIIVVFPAHFRFPVKSIYCIPSGSSSSACCLLRSVVINL